jgi:putative membrane protein
MAEDGDQEAPAEERKPYRQTMLAELAFVRTRVSFEQALMAWIRTSVSLFTFGFSLTQFFHYVEEREGISELSVGPQRLGLALVILGIVSLLLATVEHVLMLRQLKEEGMPIVRRYSLPVGSALATLAIGLVALVSIVKGWTL